MPSRGTKDAPINKTIGRRDMRINSGYNWLRGEEGNYQYSMVWALCYSRGTRHRIPSVSRQSSDKSVQCARAKGDGGQEE